MTSSIGLRVLEILVVLSFFYQVVAVHLENLDCKSRGVAVATDPGKHRFYPFFVELYRCSGADSEDDPLLNKTCKPAAVETIAINVLNVSAKTGQQITLQNHTSCLYECALDESACSVYEYFNKTICSCVCKYKKPIHSCPPPLVWNTDRCNCVCPHRLCNDFQEFNSTQCKCNCKPYLKESCKGMFDGNTCYCSTRKGLIPVGSLYLTIFLELILIMVISSFIYVVFIRKKALCRFEKGSGEEDEKLHIVNVDKQLLV